MKAKKSFGQHFLRHETVAEDIANSLIHRSAYKQVLEVGPGKGMLTKYLLKDSYTLKAIEADRDMISYLKEHYPDLDLLEGDFLKLDVKKHFTEPFALIGNFPYNISSQILFKMLEYRSLIPEMVGMFQKEVGLRVAAGPGSKTYGVISVLIQAYYDAEVIIKLGPLDFIPPPKVDSAVLRLSRKANQELEIDYKKLRQVVKTTFGQRRKMLRNTLKALFKESSRLKDPFFQQRPEQLGLEEFIQVVKWLDEIENT